MKLKHQVYSASGMTLIEVMMASASASMILIGIILMFLMVNKITASGIAQLQVQTKARSALDSIVYDVRRAQRAVIYSSYSTNGAGTYITGATNGDAGAYMIFQLPTNTVPGGTNQYHHYYLSHFQSMGNSITNARLYYFTCNSETNLTSKGPTIELVRGITNPDRVFDWINGVVNINIRVADENDVDGKQIIYLRSAVAFRNDGT